VIVRKSPSEIALMAKAGRVVAQVHEILREALRPGMSTADLDAIAEREITSRGAVPSFKGYRGFPATLCTSVNEQIVHGIPAADVALREGDLVKIDAGAIVEAFALPKGYGVVREYVGHGIGRALHEDPHVPNYGRAGRGPKLVEGLVLAVEPMFNLGTSETETLEDDWTVVTADGSLSSHWEHTVAITPDGPWVLTARSDEPEWPLAEPDRVPGLRGQVDGVRRR
jgi:methionyl aminopeptidase